MKPIRILNFITVLATIVVNILANALPINGMNTGEISDEFNALFTPAGYVFSIWGVIYIALIAFGVYQLLPKQQSNSRIDRIGIWFILANLINGGWIFAWHYQQFLLSLGLMLGLLVSLLVIYLRLGIGKMNVSMRERWLVDTPFGIYLGWISVATIANVSVVLLDNNWNGFGIAADIWTAIVIFVALVLGGLMIFQRNEVAYPLVLIWALVGITQNGSGNQVVSISAWIAAGLLLVLVIAGRFIVRRRRLMSRFGGGKKA